MVSTKKRQSWPLADYALGAPRVPIAPSPGGSKSVARHWGLCYDTTSFLVVNYLFRRPAGSAARGPAKTQTEPEGERTT